MHNALCNRRCDVALRSWPTTRMGREDDMTHTRTMSVALALLISSGPASAATIGFGGLLANGPFTSYAESGFTVANVSGDWQAFVGFGNPAPFIQFIRPTPEPTISASVQVTAGGAPFTFST